MSKRHPLKKYLFYLLPIIFLVLILLFPSQARNGAASGLLLWFNVLLPTLLPFMILSDLIRRLHIVESVCHKISYRTGKNLYFLYPLSIGLLSGLPLGAKLTAEAVRSGQLSRKSGQFLLTVCNNSSTMFLIGYVAEVQLQRPDLIGYFLLLIPLSSLLAAVLSAVICRFFSSILPHIPRSVTLVQNHTVRMTSLPVSNRSVSFIGSVSNSIMDSFTVLTQVGGFVILFSVLSEFVLLIDSPIALPLVASLEMTTGVRAVCTSTLSQHAKTILSAAAVSFTGLSGIAQTACVLSETGLSLIQYTISRIISAVLCAVFFLFLL